MVKKKEKKEEIKEIGAPIPPVSPLFSNVVSITPHRDMVMLDFGFTGPSYLEPHGFEDNHISRVCLGWDAVEGLVTYLNDAMAERKKLK